MLDVDALLPLPALLALVVGLAVAWVVDLVRRGRAASADRARQVALSRAVEAGEERLAAAQREVAQERERAADLARSIEAASRAEAALTADLAAERQERAALAAELALERQQGTALVAELEAARARLATAERDLALEQGQTAALGRGLKAERGRATQLEADVARLRRRVATLEGDLQQVGRQRAQLKAERHEHASLAAERKLAVAALRQERDEAARALAAISRDLAAVDLLLGLAARKKQGRLAVLEDAHDELEGVREQVGALRSALAASRAAAPLREARSLPAPHAADGASDDAAASSAGVGGAAPLDIVVCVHDALDDVRRCVGSVLRRTRPPFRLILVDDGSGEETAAWLREAAAAHPQIELVRNPRPIGYTRAANVGLRRSTAGHVVVLNSDTTVTTGWAERLVACAEADPEVGLVGPVSNAAGYQSVPERYGPTGDWATNALPAGWTPEGVAAAVARASRRERPRVPSLNGFCLLLTRAVIERVGLFDEARFPEGYGEENDLCLRAAAAGFALAVADDAYVHHAKSRSFSHERRRELARAGRAANIAAHGEPRLRQAEEELRQQPALAALRQAVGSALQEAPPPPLPERVRFLLPTRGGGGGAHSVVQEAAGMRSAGVDAGVLVRPRDLEAYRALYRELPGAEQLFVPFASEAELVALARDADVLVATIHTSVPLLARVAATVPGLLPAYYIQDYEPLFHPHDAALREAAEASYTLVPGATLFAKTRWLCETVGERHGATVHKVRPSLDHAVYFPGERRAGGAGPVRVAAMVRPSSPRRSPALTMAVLRHLVRKHPGAVEAHVFGCADTEIGAHGLPADFAFANHGALPREGVAALLRESDVFLDLSEYQAFGRTGLEAMACGCAVVLPAAGGTGEYAEDGANALVVDTSDERACRDAARRLATDRKLRQRLREAGLRTAAGYSVEAAARSELELFGRQIAARFAEAQAASEEPAAKPRLTVVAG